MSVVKIDKSASLGTQSIGKLVLSCFVTTLMGMMMNSLYNLTDTLFVSRGIGDIAMGGVSIIVPFVLLQGGISTMIGGGASTLVTIQLATDNKIKAGRITFNAMLLFYTIAIIITVIGLIFIDDILVLLGGVGEVYTYAREYFLIILLGNVFSTGFSSIIRAEGRHFYAMLIWVVPILINIILDAVFIFVCDYGVKGVAIATVTSQFVSFLFSIVFFSRFSVQQFKRPKISMAIIRDICKIGLPVLAQVSAFSIITMVVNIVISREYGECQLIAFSYISKVVYYLLCPILALSQAISPIISYNYGAHNHLRVKKTVAFSLSLATANALIMLIPALVIPRYIISIFTSDASIISISARGLSILSLSLPFSIPIIIMGAKLQATRKTLLAVLVNLSASITSILFIILLNIAIGLDGVWLGYVLAYVTSSTIIIFAYIIKIVWHKRHPTPIC